MVLRLSGWLRAPVLARLGNCLSGSDLALAALVLTLAACQAAGGGRAAAAPVAGAETALTTPANEAAFRTLAAALKAGNDAQAGALAQRLRQAPLTDAERGLVESAERVLAGRTLVRGLELTLASEPVPDAEGRFALVLQARTGASTPLHLRLPPADLKRLRASINARGVEGLDYESKASHALRDLVLPPGVTTRVELLTYELAVGRALAVRERWRLEPRSGEVECGGVRYPAQEVRVAGCERERVSPLVASQPAPLAALAERLEAEEAPSMRDLLELALRTPASEREAALAALTPVVERLAESAPERVATAEPALRWLTQNRDLGPNPAAWARYLATRAAEPARDGAPDDALDLPAAPGSPRREAEGSR